MFSWGGYCLLDDPDHILGQEFDEFHKLTMFGDEMTSCDPYAGDIWHPVTRPWPWGIGNINSEWI